MLRKPTRAVSVSALICFTSSLRRSSVSGGIFSRMCSPLFDGVRPMLATRMAFSITGIIFFSHGCTSTVRASGTVMLATCEMSVGVP
jgi:hypothetical protein